MSLKNKVIIYQVDGQDRITTVNAKWIKSDMFFNPNEWADRSMLGKSLWEILPNEDIRNLYQSIVSAIRKISKSVELDIRTDSMDAKRNAKLKIVPLGNGTLEFRFHILDEEERSDTENVPVTHTDKSGTIDVCNWCNSVRTNKGWKELLFANYLYDLTSSYVNQTLCPRCKSEIAKQVSQN